MRAPKQPQSGDHCGRACPWDIRREVIVGKAKPVCEEIDNRQENASHEDKRQKRALARIDTANRFLGAFRTLLKHSANDHVGHEADQKDGVPRLHRHENWLPAAHSKLAHARRPKYSRPSGLTTSDGRLSYATALGVSGIAQVI